VPNFGHFSETYQILAILTKYTKFSEIVTKHANLDFHLKPTHVFLIKIPSKLLSTFKHPRSDSHVKFIVLPKIPHLKIEHSKKNVIKN
jgi:hypothetical protein